MSEQSSPYGSGATPDLAVSRVRIPHLQQMKEKGLKWAMLTAYDM
jgi:3-methyl-2-oxobutanoate hydroxymethyltransferase